MWCWGLLRNNFIALCKKKIIVSLDIFEIACRSAFFENRGICWYSFADIDSLLLCLL